MTRIVLLILISLYTIDTAQAQERAKIRNDYFLNPTGQYSPDDPWIRSRIWRRQTGHWGKFYNCDCEEQKRYSPYICWKNAECPFVGESWRQRWQRDKARIWQRINDGSCSECTNRDVSTCNCPEMFSSVFVCRAGQQTRISPNGETNQFADRVDFYRPTIKPDGLSPTVCLIN